jgi:hypothetical protein
MRLCDGTFLWETDITIAETCPAPFLLFFNPSFHPDLLQAFTITNQIRVSLGKLADVLARVLLAEGA